MTVLLLRLAAPLQAWGVDSRHNARTTLPVPSKSGVVGLLANALGRRRAEPIDDLAALRFGVRIDQAGELVVDYHTVSGASHAPNDPARQRLPTAAGGTLQPDASTKITRRYYLADAVFVAGLEGATSLLAKVELALRRPHRPLFLGRRSCPPTPPLVLGIREDADLVTALSEEPRTIGAETPVAGLPLVVDDPGGEDAWPDHPLSFAPLDRRFAARPVRYDAVPGPGSEPPHDPFVLLTR